MLKNLSLKTLIPVLFLSSGLILIFAFYLIVLPAAQKEAYEFAEKQSRLLIQSQQGRLDTLLSSGNDTRIAYDIFFAAADQRIKMILVLDEEGIIRYAHRTKLLGKHIQSTGLTFSSEIQGRTARYGTIAVAPIENHPELIAAYAGLSFVTDQKVNRWSLIIVEEYGSILKHITSLITFPSELLATFFVIIGLLLAMVLRLRLRNRLTPLLESSAEIAAGKINVRTNLQGQDEFAELSSAFDNMAEQFENQQQQLQVAKDLAESANRAKTLFLAGISHEIRTPLTNIIGFLELMDQPDTDRSDQQLYTKSAKISAETLLGLIEDILQFSRLDAGEISAIYEPFCLNLLIQNIIEPFAQQAGENSITIRIESKSDEPIWLESDYRIIRQIVMNLMSNAIKFTSSGSVIVGIDVEDIGEKLTVTIWVKDTGFGMRPELRDEIEKYLNHTNDQDYHDNLGLGISICKRLGVIIDGKWQVESKEGEGSRFCFTIEAPKAHPTTELSFKEINTNNQNTLNILVIDDHTINRLLIQSILEKWGHNVTCVKGGAEAIEAVKATLIYPDKKYFDVFLVDINMPGMDGYETANNLRALSDETANLPGIAVTAHVSDEDKEECLKHGINGYISKPIDTEMLASEIFRVTHILSDDDQSGD
jgi:signal transduction histidine kinase/ActR/RegA family two-component response regulator